MKLRILLSISIFMLSHSVFAVIVDKLQDYSWKPLKVGAGGFVTGMYIHPNEANLMYVRTDVSGAYRWDPANSVWKQLVTSESMPADFSYYATYGGVTSIAGAPTDANIVYMAYQNRIFKSVDKGDTWTVTAFLENMDSNGDGRQEGERIVVDPHNSNLVYYGSVGNGLFRTEDGGAKWNRVTGIPVGRVNHGVNTIVFDKKSGTTNSKTKTIYVTVDGEGVYQSKDAGISWIKLVDTDIVRPAPRDAEIGPDGIYYVAYTNETGSKGAVKKYVNSVWVNITPNVGSSPYNDIAVEPNNGQQIVVISSGGSTWSSNNQGQNWTTKYEHFILQSPNIEWMGKQVTSWLSIGEILFDPHDSGKLWFAEGFGVWWTKDLGQYDYGVTWIEESRGIEETCGNTVVCPPGGKPITAQWDVGVFYHSDPDKYTAQRAYPNFCSAWHLDWSPANPNFIVGTIQNHQSTMQPQNTGYSEDGGKTWKRFASLPSDLIYGCIAVSADDINNIVWLPSNGKLPFFSNNKGNSWQQGSFSGITTSDYNGYTSPRKPLCADRVEPSTFYFYHKDGIFRSTNDGMNWTKVSNVPFQRSWNIMMKTAPGNAKHIWLAEGKQTNVVGGLWRSTNGGVTWSSVPGLQQVFSFGFGKAKEGSNYPTIYAAGVADGKHGIYRSSDQGNTWEHIGIYPLGIYDYVDDIDGDKDVFGRVYIAFSGAGFAYGDEKGKTSFESNYSNIQMKISYYNKTIGVNNVVNRVILKVYNPNGKLLMEKAGKDNFMVNISALQSDVLVITLDNGKNKFSEKIVHY